MVAQINTNIYKENTGFNTYSVNPNNDIYDKNKKDAGDTLGLFAEMAVVFSTINFLLNFTARNYDKLPGFLFQKRIQFLLAVIITGLKSRITTPQWQKFSDMLSDIVFPTIIYGCAFYFMLTKGRSSIFNSSFGICLVIGFFVQYFSSTLEKYENDNNKELKSAGKEARYSILYAHNFFTTAMQIFGTVSAFMYAYSDNFTMNNVFINTLIGIVLKYFIDYCLAVNDTTRNLEKVSSVILTEFSRLDIAAGALELDMTKDEFKNLTARKKLLIHLHDIISKNPKASDSEELSKSTLKTIIDTIEVSKKAGYPLDKDPILNSIHKDACKSLVEVKDLIFSKKDNPLYPQTFVESVVTKADGNTNQFSNISGLGHLALV